MMFQPAVLKTERVDVKSIWGAEVGPSYTWQIQGVYGAKPLMHSRTSDEPAAFLCPGSAPTGVPSPVDLTGQWVALKAC